MRPLRPPRFRDSSEEQHIESCEHRRVYTRIIGVYARTVAGESFSTMFSICNQQCAWNGSVVTPNTRAGKAPYKASISSSARESNRHKYGLGYSGRRELNTEIVRDRS